MTRAACLRDRKGITCSFQEASSVSPLVSAAIWDIPEGKKRTSMGGTVKILIIHLDAGALM